MKKPLSMSEWEYFIWRHQGKKNILFHFVSYVSFIIIVVLSFTLDKFYLLLLIPPSQYIGYLGHQISGEGKVRSKDLISPWTAIYLTRMFWLIAIGKYDVLISRVNEKANDAQLSLND